MFHSMLTYVHKHALHKLFLIFMVPRISYALIAWLIGYLTHDSAGLYHDLHRTLFVSDSLWYYSIASSGYDHGHFTLAQQANWPFFPLYPWLTKFIHVFVPAVHMVAIGMAISNISFFAFMVLLYKWMKDTLSERVAMTSVIIVGLVPLLPFFMAYRAASLFMLLSVVCLILIDKEKWAWAAVVGGIASLERPVGVLLAVPFLYRLWMDSGWSTARKIVRSCLLPLFAVGYATMTVISYLSTGYALAFIKIQATWGRFLTYPFHSTYDWFRHPVLTSDGGWSIPFLSILSSLFAVIVSIYILKDKQLRYLGVYLLLTSILANCYTTYQGVPRFVAECVPIYIGMALFTEKFKLKYPVYSMSAVFQTLYIVLWVMGIKGVLT
ncbi:hypothetical protein [Alicyclobacillus sp. ALC3]|uniref:hypothetical protein n=1 Tax=Alicyclobacillus sp. ALC3 TaxID=2796143 RepID=UPI00237A02F2|nr:hypothetical protein [Alicyclobacillus sp. ALC3]WDL97672.1 hypothetical protein JC200_02775 [Alicyclobacillus sp. ALC3]